MKKVPVVTASIIVASSLMLSPLQPAAIYAASATTQASSGAMQAYKGANLKSFMLSAKSYIQIKDVYFKYGSKDKQVFFTVTVYNGDNSPIDFMDYWVELNSTTGSKYSVKQYATDKKSGQVASKTSRDFTFYAQIDSSLNYSNLIFKLVKWDFSQPNYTRSIGQAQVTSTYQNAVPVNSYYVQTIDDGKIKSYLNAGTIFNMGAVNQVSFDLNLENMGLYEFSLPDYQFYIRTKAGLVLKLAKSQLEELSVAPGAKVNYTLRSMLKNNINLTGAQLLVTVLDAESKLEIPKAVYDIPWNTKQKLTVDEGKTTSVVINGINVQLSIGNVYTDYSSTQNNVVVTTNWLNKGDEAVALPPYKFEIMSKAGVRYPLTISETSSEVLLTPGVEKEIALQAVLPANQAEGLTLLVKQAKDEKNTLEYVTTGFNMSKLIENKGISSKVYKSEKGTYQIAISRAERLPWGNEDVINTYVDIKNTGKESQPVPDLSALLRLNGQAVDSEKVNIVQADHAGLLELNETTRLVLSTKVPYTFKFNEISLNLTEQISENKKQTIGLFKLNEIKPLPDLKNNAPLEIQSVGRRASLQTMNTYRFEGKEQDLFYTEFKYTNHELRLGVLPSLTAYYKTEDGQYIEAKLANIKSSVKPDGSAMLTVMGEIPKSMANDDSLQLIIGESLTGKAYSKPEDKADSFIAAQVISLSAEQAEVKDNLADIKVDPYTFTLKRLNTMLIDVSNVKLEMRYSLEKADTYDVIEKPTKLYFEITNGKTTYGSSVLIEPVEGEGLETGTEKDIIVPITGTQLSNLVYNGYMLNIYEEIDGYKRLLGSKKYGSFQLGQ